MLGRYNNLHSFWVSCSSNRGTPHLQNSVQAPSDTQTKLAVPVGTLYYIWFFQSISTQRTQKPSFAVGFNWKLINEICVLCSLQHICQNILHLYHNLLLFIYTVHLRYHLLRECSDGDTVAQHTFDITPPNGRGARETPVERKGNSLPFLERKIPLCSCGRHLTVTCALLKPIRIQL